MGKRILVSISCKFSVFDGCYLLTIVHCHSASSASRVRVGFINKKRNSQVSQVLLELELVLLSSSRNCGMRAAHFDQLSHTYLPGQCFRFQFSQWSFETFDIEFEANSKYFHQWEYLRERYQTVFHWKLRAS